MHRSSLMLLGLLCVAFVVGAASLAAAALTVAIVQPATDPSSAAVNTGVGFEAVAYQDGVELEDAAVQWLWQFGDATQSANNPTSHAYVAAGTYSATVTATLNQTTATATTHVTVEDGPETPKVVPFDPALSIYVGFSGTWINYATGQSEFKEIEAPVAVFQSNEQVSDDPGVWAQHLANMAPTPAGWTFFTRDDSEPMQMHVIIRDTQNRLGTVVITNRETAGSIGTVTANAAGSKIEGLVTVPTAASYFALDIKDKAGTTIALAAADNPKVDQVVVVTHEYQWDPNRGDAPQTGHPELAGQTCQMGDPKSIQGKTATEGLAGGPACVGIVPFENPGQNAGTKPSKYDLKNQEIIQNINWNVPRVWAPDAVAAVSTAINNVRQKYWPSTTLCADFPEPPFSKGKIHWPVTVNGHIESVIAAGYRGHNVVSIKPTLTAQIDWGLGVGSASPSFTVAAGATISNDLRMIGIEGPLLPIGDLWALTASGGQSPSSLDLQGIPAPYTFILRGDKTAPDDQPGAIVGTGTLTTEGYWTAVSPPTGGGGTYQLTFPQGVALDLPQGFKYKISASPMCPGYQVVTFGPFNVPGTSTPVTVTATLTTQLGLGFETVRNGQPAAGHVEVRQGSGGSGAIIWQGNTVKNDKTGCYELGGPGPVQPGTYSARCTDNGGGDWVDFTATASAGPKIIQVTVPRPGP